MRTIKIFALPSHATEERTSGVDFARVIQPMEHLNGFEYEGVKFEVTIFSPKDTYDWIEVAQNYDIIFLNYTSMDWEFAKMGLMARKFNKTMVMDVDDSLWDVAKDNPIYESLKRGSRGLHVFTSICKEVDYITTTSKFLRNVISRNTARSTSVIKVLPNFIDLDNLYTYRPKFKDDLQIRLLHFGSTTHFLDLQSEEFEKGIDMIMKEYPNVVFKTVGALIPRYKNKWGQRYESGFGHQDLYKWVKERFPLFMDETDIIVVPLEENRYTRCKSSIKYLEASSAKKAGVYQKIRQYEEVIKEGVNGYTAAYAEDWYNAIKKLIDDKEHRKTIGEQAFKTVSNDWQMKGNIHLYAQLFKNIIDKKE